MIGLKGIVTIKDVVFDPVSLFVSGEFVTTVVRQSFLPSVSFFVGRRVEE